MSENTMTRKERIAIAKRVWTERQGAYIVGSAPDIALENQLAAIIDALFPRERGRVVLPSGHHLELTAAGRWIVMVGNGCRTETERLQSALDFVSVYADPDFFRIVRECEALKARGGYADE